MLRADVTDDGEGQRRGTEVFRVELDEMVTPDALERFECSFRALSVWMVGPVQHLEECFDGPHRRVVFVLTNGRERFGLALGDFVVRERGSPYHVQHECQHIVEIFRQARAAEDCRVA
jgi:hypothetical protein